MHEIAWRLCRSTAWQVAKMFRYAAALDCGTSLSVLMASARNLRRLSPMPVWRHSEWPRLPPAQAVGARNDQATIRSMRRTLDTCEGVAPAPLLARDHRVVLHGRGSECKHRQAGDQSSRSREIGLLRTAARFPFSASTNRFISPVRQFLKPLWWLQHASERVNDRSRGCPSTT